MIPVSNTNITRCPHCNVDQGDRESFKEHVGGCGDEDPPLTQLYVWFDRVGTPMFLVILAWFEFSLGHSSLAVVFTILALMWVRQNE